MNRWHKKFANRIVEGLKQGKTLTEEEIREGFDCFDTSDFKEGYKAFIEKRAIIFWKLGKVMFGNLDVFLTLSYPIFTAKDK